MTYIIEVLSTEWAGTLRDGWRPAIAGSLNQTGWSNERASTFARRSDADSFLTMVAEQGPNTIRIKRSDGRVVFQSAAQS